MNNRFEILYCMYTSHAVYGCNYIYTYTSRTRIIVYDEILLLTMEYFISRSAK